MNLRRLLIALGFVAVVVAISFAIYFVFFRPTGPTTTGNKNAGEPGTLPSTNINVNRSVIGNANGALPVITGINVNGQIITTPTSVAQGGLTVAKPVTDKPASDVTFAPNGRDLIYYDRDTGQFFRLSPDSGTKTLISDQTFPSAETVTWSPGHDKAVVTFPDDSKIVYDFTNHKQYTLPKEAQDFSFDPASSQLAFKLLPSNPDDRWIAVSQSNGTEVRLIEPVGSEDAKVDVTWSPTGQIAALYKKGLDSTRQEIVPIGLHGENFKSFVVEGRGFQSQWSPTGSNLLYSVYSPDSQYNPQLYLVEAQGDAIGRNRLGLNLATWPDKCTFGGSSTLYCAVPQYLEPGSGLYPDQVRAPDDFYRIDLSSGRTTLIARPTDSSGSTYFRALNPIVSADGSTLYFTDAITGRLVSMKLR